MLSIDGKKASATTVTGSLAYEFDRGDIVARVHVPAGEHHIRVSFPDLAGMENPRDNVNKDERRKLWIDYLSIAGPFNPTSTPPESYKSLFICGHAMGKHLPTCSRKVVRDFASRAYRRPVTAEELNKLLELTALARRNGGSVEEGVRAAVQAVLVSPRFLFRFEQPAAESAGSHEIGEYELASRLSYFLWSSMPDKQLFQLAAAKQLRQPGILEAQIHRMMADPKASALVDGFAAQWLQLREPRSRSSRREAFPKVDEELLAAMRQETNLFVQTVMQEDRSVLDFLDATFTWVNGPLARHYGIPGVTGEQFQRVQIENKQRGGLMTQGSVLTVSSYPTRTSPVLRGKWVLENILGAPPPLHRRMCPSSRRRIWRRSSAARTTREASRESELRELPRSDGPDWLRPGNL